MSFFYKPEDGWAADFIPFFWDGEFHLFYLKDYRDVETCGEGTPWFHIATQDFCNFTDYGLALPRGTRDEPDLYVFTGSVIEADGLFHIFYTGHNPHFRDQGKPIQGVMHAVSEDLVNWQKVPEDTFFAPGDMYEPHDWRDPFVFWNPEADEYWMLLAARVKDGLSRRRGCTAVCTSTDLKHWHPQGPLYSPGLYYTHECPDLFRMGDWWYLIFSEFSEASVTRYRMSRSLQGPWLTPVVDTFDGRAFYAAKTASDGQRRFLFGWNPTREGQKDSGHWQWGGSLVVHELFQQEDGTLGVREPESVRRAFDRSRPISFTPVYGACESDTNRVTVQGPEGFACVSGGPLPQTCRLSAQVSWAQDTRALGVMLRTGEDSESGYFIRLEPPRNRLVFDRWPRRGDYPFAPELERPVALSGAKPIDLTILVDGSICEVYVDHRIAMSTRMYDHAAGGWGCFVMQGEATFEAVALAETAE